MEIQPFVKNSWNVGRPVIAKQIPWFRGKDVATSLEYGNTRDALQRHVEPEDKTTYSELSKGVGKTDALANQQPHEIYINESGLYRGQRLKPSDVGSRARFCLRSGSMEVTVDQLWQALQSRCRGYRVQSQL